jgi:hypothetical protein
VSEIAHFFCEAFRRHQDVYILKKNTLAAQFIYWMRHDYVTDCLRGRGNRSRFVTISLTLLMRTCLYSGVPSLLEQAARTAAEADGVALPPITSSNDNAAAAAALTSIGGAINSNAAQGSARPATAGSAAHAMMSGGGISGARKAPPLPAAIPPAASAPASKKKGPPLRRGKWTAEEEAYATRLIHEFKGGLLPLTDGTTLRTFLSKLLNCDPMRISKKFVGGNCIGKQVFRRRTPDINRLTPEQIQQSRVELSELERRFLERVAQTNRVKSSGVANGGGNGAAIVSLAVTGLNVKEEMGDNAPPSPPWLAPPHGYKHGHGAAMAAAANSRAAAAGRALLQSMSMGGGSNKPSSHHLPSHGSAGLLAMAELHRHNSRQNLLNSALSNRSSANNFMATAAASNAGSGSGLSGSAMAQIARNASAARLAGLTAAGGSMNNLLLKTGLSREQLSQLARDGASSASLSNMMERQSSFDALMSLDFQSLQSIDNLANLIQTGAQTEDMKNWSADLAALAQHNSNNNLSNLANARRLASAGHMESLLRSLSSGAVNKTADTSSAGGSNANFNNLLQSMQSNLGNLAASENSASSLFGSAANAASAMSLASLLRADSSTGLSALRMQDGIDQRNTSVDDFLSLVASGDIPHQDALLNVPLMHQQSQGQGNNSSAASLHQHLLDHASNSSNSALANAFRSGSLGNLHNNALTQALQSGSSSAALKRKLMDLQGGGLNGQGPSKR